MDINAGNILIILIGIALCFFGIYFKRSAQIMIGFAWGALFAWLVILVISVQGAMNEDSSVIAVFIVLAIGILMAVLSVKLERLLVTIQGVLLSLVITLSIFGSLLGDDGMAAAIIVSLIISAIMGYLLWMYYRYAFICETAIIGSIMINHVWLLGSEELNAFSVILTIIIAAAGIKVQSRWLRKMEGGTPKKRINIEKKINPVTPPPIQKPSVSRLFSNGDVQKAGMASLCTYEKLLVLIPIFVFVINNALNRYAMYMGSEGLYAFLESGWRVRSCLSLLLQGAFAGCIVYFVIYYETKVSAIYQLLYLLGFWGEILPIIQYGQSQVFSGSIQYGSMTLLKYCIPWLIFVGLDRALHSEKMKVIVMTVLSVLWFPAISDWLSYGGGFYVAFDMFYILPWIGNAGTVLGLVWLRKRRKY